jgi:hypothetical protein
MKLSVDQTEAMKIREKQELGSVQHNGRCGRAIRSGKSISFPRSFSSDWRL